MGDLCTNCLIESIVPVRFREHQKIALPLLKLVHCCLRLPESFQMTAVSIVPQ